MRDISLPNEMHLLSDVETEGVVSSAVSTPDPTHTNTASPPSAPRNEEGNRVAPRLNVFRPPTDTERVREAQQIHHARVHAKADRAREESRQRRAMAQKARDDELAANRERARRLRHSNASSQRRWQL